MASNINPLNINGNYPIAGQDNDSQGFRDNFTNIKTNFNLAKTEIEDLQNKALLTTALGPSGGEPENDLNFAPLYRANLKSNAHAFNDLGTVSGLCPISFLDGNFQKFTTVGPLTISLSDFPAAGIAGSLRLWMTIEFEVGQTSAEITLPSTVTLGVANFENLNTESMILTISTAGDYLLEFVTVDGGNNFWIINVA